MKSVLSGGSKQVQMTQKTGNFGDSEYWTDGSDEEDKALDKDKLHPSELK